MNVSYAYVMMSIYKNFSRTHTQGVTSESHCQFQQVWQNAFKNACTHLYCHQQCREIPPQSHKPIFFQLFMNLFIFLKHVGFLPFLFREVPVQVFCPLFIGLPFFLMIHQSSLNVLDLNRLIVFMLQIFPPGLLTFQWHDLMNQKFSIFTLLKISCFPCIEHFLCLAQKICLYPEDRKNILLLLPKIFIIFALRM